MSELPRLAIETQTFTFEEIDQQWALITEAVRRDISTKPETRTMCASFSGTPLSETLPEEFLVALSEVDERIAKLTERYSLSLGQYLQLPPSLDEKSDPDLSESILSIEEKKTVRNRYKFARDVKLMALGALLLEQEIFLPDSDDRISLPGGIEVGTHVSKEEQIRDLLQPHLWEERKQIKDRVYEISVNGRRYILKERKTALHKSIKKTGHQPGLSSAEEFEVASQLQKSTRLHPSNILLTWESPIGYVMYPDGFQFALFEYEEGLVDGEAAIFLLAKEIISHRDQFEREYQKIAKLTIMPPQQVSWLKSTLRLLGAQRDTSAHLTFEDFAMVKACRMQKQAKLLLKLAMIENNYHNADHDGYAFRVYSDNLVRLEVVGFDFEYLSEMSSRQAATERQFHLGLSKERDERDGIGFTYWNVEKRLKITDIQNAAYRALLEVEKAEAS